MHDTVTLVGLDFGTTTSCAATASANLTRNAVTGRMELTRIEPRCCSEPVFTPFSGDQLDEHKLADYLDLWLKDIRPAEVFGGGAMITGLAAQAPNAAGFVRRIRGRLNNAVIAVAADPCLESWLAFMGNCWELSRANPERTFVNLDIGGGTTNVALGRNGEVLRTGCYFIGARHVQFEPGAYRVTALSSYARALLDHLRISKNIGDHLTESEVQAIVDWYLVRLESVVTGSSPTEVDSLTALHRQIAFDEGPHLVDVAVTVSGGVGQLVYRAIENQQLPGVTAYSDLGVDLAQGFVQRQFWRERLTQFVPAGLGRATLFGLLRHNTQVSGSTLHLNDARRLPLNDLIILGSISTAASQAEVENLVALAARTADGACLKIEVAQCDRASIQGLAERLRLAITRQPALQHIPLVLIVRENLGKVLGQWVTDWGRSAAKVIVLDEIDCPEAQFASIGGLHNGVVPVSFYGMNSSGESS